jgi:hypothetical protein
MLSHDLNINAGYLFFLLAMSLGFICAIVPTGCISLVWVVVK